MAINILNHLSRQKQPTQTHFILLCEADYSEKLFSAFGFYIDRKYQYLIWQQLQDIITLEERVIIIKSMESNYLLKQYPQLSPLTKMLQTHKSMNTLSQVEKTVFIFYLQQCKSQNQKNKTKAKQIALLNNMNTFAQYILNTSLTIEVETGKKKSTVYKLSSEAKQKAKSLMSHRRFHFEEATQYDIHLFETKQNRVVLLPLDKQLLEVIKRKENVEIEEEKKKNYKQFFEANPQTQENREKLNEINRQCYQKRVTKGQLVFNKTSNIEDLLWYLLEKTKKASILGILEHEQNIEKEQKGVFEYLQKIVETGNVKPRLLVFHDNEEDQSENQDVKKFLKQDICSAVFSYDSDQQFEVREKFTVWISKYFYEKSNFKFKFYSNLRSCDSPPIQEIIQEFMDNLKETAVEAIGAVAQIHKTINFSLGAESIIQKKIYNSFQGIDKKYKISQLQIPQTEQLKNYYTKENVFVSTKKEGQAGQRAIKIPAALNNVVFLHCFHKIHQTITSQETKNKFNTEKRLQSWKKGLKNVFSLIATLFEAIKGIKNQSQLRISQLTGSQVLNKIQDDKNSLSSLDTYDDIQKYYSFVCFLFSGIQRFNRILGEGTAFVDQLKTLFNSLSLKEGRIIKFITQNKRLIRTNEQLIYYDLLIYLIEQYKGKTVKENLESIECHILQLKASEIASKYIYDEARIVQAIQAYVKVCIKFNQFLHVKNNDLFNIFEVELKIARLLNIIGLQEDAAEIYMHLKMYGKARDLYRQYRWHFQGDARAEKLMKWAKEFQKQLEWDFAVEFYREAFETASTDKLKLQAFRCKRSCVVRRRKQESEEQLRALQKYLKQQNLLQFTNQQKLKSLFMRLQKLSWDEKNELVRIVD